MRQDEISRMAREAAQLDGTNPPEKSVTLYAAKSSRFLEKFAALVAAAEREECAKVCDSVVIEHPGRADLTADQCAAAIRARGNV